MEPYSGCGRAATKMKQEIEKWFGGVLAELASSVVLSSGLLVIGFLSYIVVLLVPEKNSSRVWEEGEPRRAEERHRD